MDHDDRLRTVEMQINTHEAVCAERYAGIIHSMGDMKDAMTATNKLLVKVGFTILTAMGGLLAKLTFWA